MPGQLIKQAAGCVSGSRTYPTHWLLPPPCRWLDVHHVGRNAKGLRQEFIGAGAAVHPPAQSQTPVNDIGDQLGRGLLQDAAAGFNHQLKRVRRASTISPVVRVTGRGRPVTWSCPWTSIPSSLSWEMAAPILIFNCSAVAVPMMMPYFFSDIDNDGFVHLVATGAHGLPGDDAVHRNDRYLRGPTTHADDHITGRRTDRQVHAKGGSKRLLDEIGIAAAGLEHCFVNGNAIQHWSPHREP